MDFESCLSVLMESCVLEKEEGGGREEVLL
jgi:hypothetical protein